MTNLDIQDSLSPDKSAQPGNSQSPNHVIKTMYLEINNIAQGLNVGLFVLVLTAPGFYNSFASNYYSTPLLALASLMISIIFWTRYYFDTEILDRSYTALSAFWFFAYVVSQGISISLISIPVAWFLGTGLFLLFGAGFYALNLSEIQRKRTAGMTLTLAPDFEAWQHQRRVELLAFSALSFLGAGLAFVLPFAAFPAAALALIAALWQLAITDDYRKRKFIETGA